MITLFSSLSEKSPFFALGISQEIISLHPQLPQILGWQRLSSHTVQIQADTGCQELPRDVCYAKQEFSELPFPLSGLPCSLLPERPLPFTATLALMNSFLTYTVQPIQERFLDQSQEPFPLQTQLPRNICTSHSNMQQSLGTTTWL